MCCVWGDWRALHVRTRRVARSDFLFRDVFARARLKVLRVEPQRKYGLPLCTHTHGTHNIQTHTSTRKRSGRTRKPTREQEEEKDRVGRLTAAAGARGRFPAMLYKVNMYVLRPEPEPVAVAAGSAGAAVGRPS